MDGKRPDGVSITPWSAGKPLVWDATCPDTFAVSYQGFAVRTAEQVATRVETQKTEKYSNLSHSHNFIPISIKSTGVFGPRTIAFVKDLGRRIARQMGDWRATTYLKQHLVVASQRGNTVSVMGSLKSFLVDDCRDFQ